MYSLLRTKEFQKSLKRIRASGVFKKQDEEELSSIIQTLLEGGSLSATLRDHKLKGALSEYRECHVKGDLLLVYQINKEEGIITLVQIGSHSYLKL